MRDRYQSISLCLALTLVCCACASQPKQETITQIAKTESSINQAETLGAQEGALPDLQQARDKLAEARSALQRKDERQAVRLAQQAQVDAQYAAAKARAQREERAASEVREGVNTVRETSSDTTRTPTSP